MSVVTGVMLLVSIGDGTDHSIIDEIQAWLKARGRGQLAEISDYAGGSKHPQFEAFTAGINYFLEDAEFCEFVLSREWKYPENVVLILQPEDGPTRVFRPIAG